MRRILANLVIVILKATIISLFLIGGSSCLLMAYVEYPDMTMNATPNPVGSGARAMGMGGAFISVADDATAASWNPGGLIQLTKEEVSIVGSFFSGKAKYSTFTGAEIIEEDPPEIHRLNYLSAVLFPFVRARRNFVFSLNYQHLYEFYQNRSYAWREELPSAMIDTYHKDHKYQRGSLNTISPAFAIQIAESSTRSFYLGLTCNFWDDDFLDNGWENIYIHNEEGLDHNGYEVISHEEIYERYDFSGFNMNIGFLYYQLLSEGKKLQIGGVLKTPFDARIRHEQRKKSYKEYPTNPVLNEYVEESLPAGDPVLRMPISYGLGFSLFFSEGFFLAFDIYRTHWDRYVLKNPSGEEWSPINKELKDKAGIKPTTQVRLGGEYTLIQDPRKVIPIRAGLFYDPEPAPKEQDDIFGASLGTGITYNERFSFDMAYQFRFGKKGRAETIEGKDVSSRIKQHYLYTSMIFYFR